MLSKHLHIVCLDVPYPVDYGGVFDLYYKLEALHQHGVKIHLHCYEYGRGVQPALNKFCEEIYYYRRSNALPLVPPVLPYIVKSRNDKKLLRLLQKDRHPVLLEGIHCTYLLNKGALDNRKVVVRLHNVEYLYYKHLANAETSPKKLYFLMESALLERYEKQLCNKAPFLAVSQKDVYDYLALGCKNVEYLPVFHPFTYITSQPGMGDACLYHGNLSVSENEKAALWLIRRVFTGTDRRLIIAGKKPSKALREAVKNNPNTSLVADPDDQVMKQLISTAHINILPSFNQTGIKIKLLHALFTGRHCLVNTNAVKDTGLESFCHRADDADDFKKAIEQLFSTPFSQEEIDNRKTLLEGQYNNHLNAERLMQVLF